NLRVLIVDDEVHARRGLRALLRQVPGVEVVADCADGPTAVELIRTLPLDVVMLDVQMPGMNGFDVIRAVGAEGMPLTIFITAYDEYAVPAFEVHAADYLLKPIRVSRLKESVARARELLRGAAFQQLTGRLRALLEAVDHGNTELYRANSS